MILPRACELFRPLAGRPLILGPSWLLSLFHKISSELEVRPFEVAISVTLGKQILSMLKR